MKKTFLSLFALALALSYSPATAAAPAAGQKCTSLNQKVTVAGKKLICTKVGSKVIWKVVTATPKPTSTPKVSASPTPSATASPSPSATPPKWKQLTAEEIIAESTKTITAYFSVKRTTNQEVIVLVQPGIDPLWKDFIFKGATVVAQAFVYPPVGKPFYDVVATDKEWLAEAYKGAGFSEREVQDRLGGFATGSPAFGGATTNTWNMSVLKASNALVNDKAGAYQTPGHEFFHGIQERYAGRNPGPGGEQIPNWFWEGPAMYVGLHSAAYAGFIDFKSEGRESMVKRFKNGRPQARALSLIEVKANDGVVDPYAIGFAATEYLVAQVGVEKFVDIYAELGKGKSFASAFESATGFALNDFYDRFEEARAGLGFPRG